MGWAVELRSFLDVWFWPELWIRRFATVPESSKDGCASSRRPRPFSSLKTAIRRSDTIHKTKKTRVKRQTGDEKKNHKVKNQKNRSRLIQKQKKQKNKNKK